MALITSASKGRLRATRSPGTMELCGPNWLRTQRRPTGAFCPQLQCNLRFVLCHVRHFCKADLSISGLPGRHQGDLRRGSFSRKPTESALSTSLVRPCVKIVKSKYHLCLFTRMFQKRAGGGQQQLWALGLGMRIDCCYCDTVEGCKGM